MDDEFSDINEEMAAEMFTVISVATSLIMKDVTAEKFLQWARESIPILAPSAFKSVPGELQEQYAFWIGFDLWNAAPLPSNNFKPNPLPKPERNTSCPCGSTRKYKQCCAQLPSTEAFPKDIYWSFIPQVCSKAYINKLIKKFQMPVIGIAHIAEYYCENDDFQQTIKVLDPLFADEAERLNQNHFGILDMLIDSYNNHYRTDKKKKALLERMCQHKNGVIRAEAWQIMAGWLQDQGQSNGALTALTEAMRADPDNPTHSLLELTLLLADNRIEQAKHRATFWLSRLKRRAQEFPEIIDILTLAKTDPTTALQLEVFDNYPLLERLLLWCQRPVPDADYSFELLEAENNVEESDEWLDDDTHYPSSMSNGARIVTPNTISNLEENWRSIRPLEKPFSIHFDAPIDEDLWEDEGNDEWLIFLEQNPATNSSLEIIDDVITLINMHPLGNSPWGLTNKIQPLLEYALNILRQLKLPTGKTLPWIVTENRPILRILAHNIFLSQSTQSNQAPVFELMHEYIHFNPTDNHGFRAELVNYYIAQNLNAEAIALCKNYPEDMMAEIRYGNALALYRSSGKSNATEHLIKAIEDLPLVASYLVKKRIAKPAISDVGITYGGKDQAWIYRQEMRDEWVHTPDSLDWLKTISKLVQSE